jgi:hypothetical protein
MRREDSPTLKEVMAEVRALVEAREGLVRLNEAFLVYDRERVEVLNREYLGFLSTPNYRPDFSQAVRAIEEGLRVLEEQEAVLFDLRERIGRLQEKGGIGGRAGEVLREFLESFEEQHAALERIHALRKEGFELQRKNLAAGLEREARWKEPDWRGVDEAQEEGRRALERAVDAYRKLEELLGERDAGAG